MELTPAAYWLNTALAGFDQSVTGAVHQLYLSAGGFFTPFFKLISLLGKGGIFLIILSICLMLYKKTRRYGTAMAFLRIKKKLVLHGFFKGALRLCL